MIDDFDRQLRGGDGADVGHDEAHQARLREVADGELAGPPKVSSHLALARLFRDGPGADLLPVEGQIWYRYTGSVWREVYVDYVVGRLWPFLDETMPRGKVSRGTVNSVYNAAVTLADWRIEAVKLNADPWLVNVKNGVVNLRTGELGPHDRNLYQTVQRPFDFDPQADAERFAQLATDVFVDSSGEFDLALSMVAQEWFGYCLVPLTSAQKAAIWVGEGANGKGVVQGVLEALVGREHVVGTDITKLDDPYNRAALKDKLLATTAETPSGKLVSDSWLKAIVAGDTILARNPHERPFSYRPFAKLLIVCNELPASRDHSYGYYRRMLILPFLRVIPEEQRDPGLLAHLVENELPGIFNWALVGLMRLQAQGWQFTSADAVSRLVTEYAEEADSVRMWAVEHVVPDKAARSKTGDLYAHYRRWAEGAGLKPTSMISFGRRLKVAAPYALKWDTASGKGWKGVRLSEDTEVF